MATQNPAQNLLVIADIAIRQDSEGRYCINDLHRASGGAEKDKPNRFLRLESTRGLIAELRDTQKWASEKINNLEPIRTVNSFTEEQGTFVVKELVYAYAMWISPAFHLKVIRAYDALVTQPQQPAFDPMQILNDPAAMRGLLLNYTEKVLALEEIVQAQKPKVEFHDAVAEAVTCQSIQEIAKVLGTGQNRLFKFLRDQRVLMVNNLPYQQYVDQGYFRVVERRYQSESGDNHLYTKTLVTGKGLQFIQRRLQNAQLELDLGSE